MEPAYPDAIDYVRAGAPVIALRTFSKAYGLAGLRIGWAAAAASVIEAIDLVREPFNSNVPGQAAALAALGDTAHVAATLELTRAERAAVTRGLEERGLRVLPSLANFVCVDLGRPAGPGTRLTGPALLKLPTRSAGSTPGARNRRCRAA